MKHKLTTAWGTDTLFDQKLADRQGAQLSKMKRWYPSADVIAGQCSMITARVRESMD